LVAVIRDADGAVSRHELTFFAAADPIRPEVAILQPELGYPAVEASDFTFGFQAFDNVKVDRLEVSTTYGARLPDGTYRQAAYGPPLRTIDAIEPKDFDPVSTVNIDTPPYTQIVHVGRLAEIGARLPDVPQGAGATYDIWLKLAAVDASGNRREKEVK